MFLHPVSIRNSPQDRNILAGTSASHGFDIPDVTYAQVFCFHWWHLKTRVLANVDRLLWHSFVQKFYLMCQIDTTSSIAEYFFIRRFFACSKDSSRKLIVSPAHGNRHFATKPRQGGIYLSSEPAQVMMSLPRSVAHLLIARHTVVDVPKLTRRLPV